jgi:hypothetical protein
MAKNPNPMTPSVESLQAVEMPEERLSQEEMDQLEKAKTKLSLLQSQAENAELLYKNLILNIFLQHGLSSTDTIAADGTIQRAAK